MRPSSALWIVALAFGSVAQADQHVPSVLGAAELVQFAQAKSGTPAIELEADSDDEETLEQPPFFISMSAYKRMSEDERRNYLMGVMDGYLMGHAQATAGWQIAWVTSCLNRLTIGDLAASTTEDVERMSAIGAAFADGSGAPMSFYTALVNVCGGPE